MAKKRKNLGKVKRYRHSFHSGKSIAINIVLWVLLVIAVGAGGYFLAPKILDWGTSTWYALTDGIGGGDSDQADLPEATPIPEEPEPTPDPTPIEASGVVDGIWADVSLSALTSDALIAQTIDSLAAQGTTYVVVTLKDTSGYIHYASGLEQASQSIAATLVDIDAVVCAIIDAGMIPVASIATFQDPISGYQDKSLAIGYVGTDYRWLDNTAEAGGKAWMNPYADVSVTFIGDIISEVSDLGFAHVLLGQVQFPNQISSSQDFGEIGDATRVDALCSAIAAWDARFEEQDITIWIEYDYETCLTESNITGGVLPSSLGITNLLINLPLATEDNPDPDISALEAVVDDCKENGSEYVVVQQSGVAWFA